MLRLNVLVQDAFDRVSLLEIAKPAGTGSWTGDLPSFPGPKLAPKSDDEKRRAGILC